MADGNREGRVPLELTAGEIEVVCLALIMLLGSVQQFRNYDGEEVTVRDLVFKMIEQRRYLGLGAKVK